jgi:hypothetical protein
MVGEVLLQIMRIFRSKKLRADIVVPVQHILLSRNQFHHRELFVTVSLVPGS